MGNPIAVPAPTPTPEPERKQRVTTVSIPGVTKETEWKDVVKAQNPMRDLTPEQIEKVREYQEFRELQRTQEKALDELAGYKSGEGYDINQYLLDSKSPGKALKTLRDAGFSDDVIKQVTKENLKMAEEARERVKQQYSKSGIAKYAGKLTAELVVPGYYTATSWGKMGAASKALSIGLDVITIIPFAKAAGMGAREVATAGRVARATGAVKGVARESFAQLRAPVDIIAHPVATAKGTVGSIRDLGENLLHPKK